MFRTTTWYIYSLSDPGSGKIKYIGMTKNPEQRLKAYKSCRAGNREVKNWLIWLEMSGLEPQMNILEKVNDYSLAKKKEKRWIKKGISRKWPLLNHRKLPDDYYGDWD